MLRLLSYTRLFGVFNLRELDDWGLDSHTLSQLAEALIRTPCGHIKVYFGVLGGSKVVI